MTIIEKTIPLDALGLREGDTLVGFRLTGGNMILQVAASTANPVPIPLRAKTKLGDWGRKWAGSLELAAGETRESLKAEAMAAKFGS